MSSILANTASLSQSSSSVPSQFPPAQRHTPLPFWQPPNTTLTLTTQSRQLPPSPSLNVQELNHDLLKLKEQLKKLAERGEEMGATRARAQEAQSARIRIQSFHQVPPQIRTNTSASQLPSRKQASSDLIFYPSTTSHPTSKPPSELPKQSDPSPPSKREKIDSFMHGREDRGKIIPLVNPNKREFYNRINSSVKPEGEKVADLEKEVKELKEKLAKTEAQLQKSQQQKQGLALQIKSLLKANEQLRELISKGTSTLREAKSKSMILEPTISLVEYEQKQKKASIIIDRLNSQILQLKTSENRASFDDALKSQLQENKLLKVRLDEKGEELQNLKDSLNTERINNQSLKNQLKTLQLKANAELRVKESKLEVQLSDKSNELQTARRALETLELKYRTAVHEIKEKDSFIMNYMVGRSKETDQEEIRATLEKYRIQFPENRTMEVLIQEQKEIESLREEVRRLTGNNQ